VALFSDTFCVHKTVFFLFSKNIVEGETICKLLQNKIRIF